LDKSKILRYVDYLSCVSGGGYTGSAFLSHLFDERTHTKEDEDGKGKKGKEEKEEGTVHKADALLSKSTRTVRKQMKENIGYLVRNKGSGVCLDILILLVTIGVTLSLGPLMLVCAGFPVALFIDTLWGSWMKDLECAIADLNKAIVPYELLVFIAGIPFIAFFMWLFLRCISWVPRVKAVNLLYQTVVRCFALLSFLSSPRNNKHIALPQRVLLFCDRLWYRTSVPGVCCCGIPGREKGSRTLKVWYAQTSDFSQRGWLN